MSESDGYDKGELERLLFQTDNLFHNRVNILLLAETIFFAGAMTAWEEWPLVLVLTLLGIATAVLCTFTNLKLYWRLHWMIEEYKKLSRVFSDFATYSRIDRRRGTYLTKQLIDYTAPAQTTPHVWLGTGWLFTWGFFWIICVGWVLLAMISILGSD